MRGADAIGLEPSGPRGRRPAIWRRGFAEKLGERAARRRCRTGRPPAPRRAVPRRRRLRRVARSRRLGLLSRSRARGPRRRGRLRPNDSGAAGLEAGSRKRAGKAGRAASRRAAGSSGGVPRSEGAGPPVPRRESAPAVLRLGPRGRAPLRHRCGARRRGHERQLRRPRARRALRRAGRDRVVPVDLRFPRGSHRSPSHRHFDGESHRALRRAQRPERRHPAQGTARPGGELSWPMRRRRRTIRSREPSRSWDWEARDFAGFR